jgi:hypothetical protein
MANTTSTAIGQQQLYNDAVLRGFVQALAPLRAFSIDASPAPAEKGYTVNMTFIPSGSTPVAWSETTGYAIHGATRTAKAISLSNHYFNSTALTDIEIANSSLMKIEDTAYNQGAALGNYVFDNVISYISGSNFSNNLNVATASALTVANLISVRKKATDLGWGAARNVILNPTAFASILADTKLLYLNRGATDAVQMGTLSNCFGWQNVYETAAFPTDLQSGSNFNLGCAVTPDALLVAMRYLQPAGDEGNKQLIDAYPLTDPAGSGITLGFRKWYDPDLGKVKAVYECVWGVSVGNPAGAINITSTDTA